MEDETVTPTSEETEETTEETTGKEETEVEIDWKAEALKAKELAENQKRRAEKAEKLAKEAKTKQETVITGELSQTDVIYFAKSDIHEEDIKDVIDWAKFRGISVKEAHEQLKPSLSIKQEQRTTAAATETKSGRGVKPKTGEDYLEKARRTGEIPTDDAEMQKLILARQKQGRR